MRYEADDVPKKFLEQGTWEQAEIALEDIQIESALIEEQEREALHIERRDRFVDAIQKGRPILPLIILRRSIKSV